MKANRKFIDGEEEAVSAVIGVILMIAITVAIAATVYVYTSGMTGSKATKTSTLLVSAYDKDDDSNKIIWYVTGVEGDSVKNTSFTAAVLNSTTGVGLNVSLDGNIPSGPITAWVNFTDNNGDGHVNPGDVFSVKAQDGNFVFFITDIDTGSNIFKSESTHY